MKNSTKTIYVGVSGGVDSSVALLYAKMHYKNVVGAFMRVWQPDFLPCSWKQDRLDAIRTCAFLEIPFMEFDLQKEYKQYVVDYMISEYKSGRTPNPDVMCNTKVKFDAFYTASRNHGADEIATGHYTQHDGLTLQKHNDTNKDQTYFLWGIQHDVLTNSRFPIGIFQNKQQVRNYAKRYNLPSKVKKDSQGLCFLGHVNMKDFLSHFIEIKKGEILLTDGKVVGEHDGVGFYTIGQSHGFRYSFKGANKQKYFIVKKDIVLNTVTIGTKAELEMLCFSKKVRLSNVVIRDTTYSCIQKFNEPVYVEVRYHGMLYQAFLKNDTIGYYLEFTEKYAEKLPFCVLVNGYPDVVYGQSAVMYNWDAKLVGGGILEPWTN